MKNDEKLQEFSGFDAVSLFALLLSSVIIVWGIIVHGLTAQRLSQARIDCDTIAAQILSEMDGRMVASKVDRSSVAYQKLDPWGHHYRFRQLIDKNDRRVVAVYSAGPNGRFDTADHDFITDKEGRLLSVRFKNDDIGTIQKSWP